MTRHWAKATLAVALVALAACSSRPKIDTSIGDQRAARLQKAMELTERGDRARERGLDSEAAGLYKQAVSTYPELASAWNNLGVLMMEQMNYIDAVEAFKRAAEQSPNDPRPVSNIGLTYHKAGFDEKALTYYEQAMSIDPRWLDALRGATRANIRLRAYDPRAQAIVERGLLVDPDPEWRAIYERERYRIESAQRLANRGN